VAAVIGVAFCLISHFSLFHGIQLQVGDSLFKAAGLHSGIDPAGEIVIVAIDDNSLEQLGNFSLWPRSFHAQLVDVLAEAGARVIVFDVLFSEPAQDDEALAASISNAGNVILPFVYTVASHQSTAVGQAITLERAIRPLGTLEESALTAGHANVLPDGDGIVRRLPLVVADDEGYEPSLALNAIARYLRRPQAVESPVRDNSLVFTGRTIPLDGSGSMLLNYTGDSGARLNLATVSYVDTLRGDSSPAAFQDKIVVIGVTATGLGDTFWTPLGQMMNGVELHVIAMHTILSGNFLKPAPSAADVLVILVLTFLCGLAVLRFRLHWATLSAAFLFIAYFLAAFFFFDAGIMLNMLHPPLAIAGTFVGVNIYNVMYERSEKTEITRTFGRYISPPVVNKILATVREDDLSLGGKMQEITAMFVDARHFTSLTENIRSEVVVEVLNTYMTVIIESVLKYEGIINSFGGDSIMAVWNAPLESADHPLLATRAAINTRRAISGMQNKDSTLIKMDFGISVNTGEAVVGNMGSRDRLEYSVIGDAVNIAARLASAAPGGKIWIGAGTYERVKDLIPVRRLEPISARGRHEPVPVYEILDDQDYPADESDDLNKFLKVSVTNHEG
jgi:adenylate cyclase